LPEIVLSWGAPAWAHFAVPAAAVALGLFTLLGLRALRRKRKALGILDPEPADGKDTE
jgi:hypothetical protein